MSSVWKFTKTNRYTDVHKAILIGTIDDKSFGVLNVRQNILIKYVLGLDSRRRTKSLLHCLDVDKIGQLYHNHKLVGITSYLLMFSND